jgi:hypothetical protein
MRFPEFHAVFLRILAKCDLEKQKPYGNSVMLEIAHHHPIADKSCR